MKDEKRSSTTLWMTIALTGLVFTVVLTAAAGFFLGHFTG